MIPAAKILFWKQFTTKKDTIYLLTAYKKDDILFMERKPKWKNGKKVGIDDSKKYQEIKMKKRPILV